MNNYLIIVLKGIVAIINEVLAWPSEMEVFPTKKEAEGHSDERITPEREAFIPHPGEQSPAGDTVVGVTGSLDSEGLPWDERIHSSGKTMYKSGKTAGQWKLARGVDEVTVAKVKTELAGGTNGMLDITKDMMGNAGAPDPPGPEVTPTAKIDTWAGLVQAITAAGIVPEVVQAACDKYNVENLGSLQDVPVLVPMVSKELGL